MDSAAVGIEIGRGGVNEITITSMNPPSPMTSNDVLVLITDRIESLHRVFHDGTKEYAHDTNRPFRNFEEMGEDIHVPREKSAWVLAKKHIDGIIAYINGHRSQREPIAGRFKDLHLYLYLIEAMLQEDVELGR